MRIASDAYELTQEDPDTRMIAKSFKRAQTHTIKSYLKEAQTQECAQICANAYNAARAKSTELPDEVPIMFIPVCVISIVENNSSFKDSTNCLGLEAFISHGKYTKYTNNAKFIADDPDLDGLTAFSHFSYEASDRKCIVCDLQGWKKSVLTDPQIHSAGRHFASGDMGKEGIKLVFQKQHPKCNNICKVLGMRPFQQ